eukprot:CAMPEP_0171086058 /NCGR_PEP_ID=MMETSP0766_2-20121228/19309_1 /TAXON_ID=439317 /ORGANISM="Gambierdiscus australes, Strain CAWD 149" /LENGTH=347 /DNA_ID=CAMNT_0011543667 /DNA_START=42 /DNA_END=1082 /DNA_ORIENTATION=-
MAKGVIGGLSAVLLQAVAVFAQHERCNEPDLATLAQREVHLSRPLTLFSQRSRAGDAEAEAEVEAEKTLAKLESSIDAPAGARKFRSLLRTIITQVQTELEEKEHSLQAESAQALLVKSYLDKVRQTLFRKGTLFSDMGGLVPLGRMDDTDRAVASTLLNLFRREAFAWAVAKGISNVADAMMRYRWRAEKRVASLMATSANTTDAKLSALLVSFFQNQQHLMSDVLGVTLKSMNSVAAELPANYSVMTKFVSAWTDQLLTKAKDLLDANIEAITKSHGDVFCQNGQQFLLEGLLPTVNITAVSLHEVVQLAKAQAPDMGEHLIPVREALATIPLELGRLEKLAQVW